MGGVLAKREAGLEFTPHGYQDYSVNWVLKNPYSGLFLDMGLGKTIITLTAIDYLKSFGMVDKVLIIAPLAVAERTWSDEIDKWSHTRHLTYSKIIGSRKQRDEALSRQADIYIINRDNTVWLVDKYLKDWPFELVVIDELSSFKDTNAKRFRALRKVRPKIKRIVGLTGTPAPNSLIDLWAQMYLIDRGERLETSVTRYRNKYFFPEQSNGYVVYKYGLRNGAEETIYGKIGDICISMKAKDYLKLPQRINNNVEVNLTSKQEKLYKQLERDYVLSLDESDIVASNAAVLAGKLLQMANGAIYDEERNVVEIHDRKLEALERIVEEAQGEPILVFYNYKHDLSRILAKFKEAKVLDVANGDIEKWNNKEIPILLAHPQSAGHGLNLQKGGHIIVWFGVTWSLEYYQQANARLDRQGQTEAVIVHHLITKGTVDEIAIKRLEGKEQGQDELTNALKAKIKE